MLSDVSISLQIFVMFQALTLSRLVVFVRRVPSGRTVVSFTIMKRVFVSPYYQAIGTREITMTELVELCDGKDGTSAQEHRHDKD